ncbi:MAG: hypothetical protein LUE87_08645 [Lachnospiraceae bacterium]|nr:hypothetical protein [Lachnospiraceae bacterium]
MGDRRKKKASKKRGRNLMMVVMAALFCILCVVLLAVKWTSEEGTSTAVTPVELEDQDSNGESTEKYAGTELTGEETAGSSEKERAEMSDQSASGKETEAGKEPASGEETAAEDETSQTAVDAETGQTDEDTAEELAREILSSMTLNEQVYQLFIVRPEQLTGVGVATQASEVTGQALEDYPVGGIVYFAAIILTRDQCSTMIANSQSYSKIGLFIAVDEEGGTVARVGNNSAMGTTSFPNMKTIGDTGDTDNAYYVGYTIGSELKELGFNLDFAPVADVDSNPDNPVIGDRAFSSDAAVASEMVSAAVQGFHDGGILCTLKHFPGHGDTATDSHEGYTELDKTLEELKEVEFVPFEGGISAGADFVMVGHISVPQVTGDDLPATLSATMIGILRNDLGFDGLIITDSMQMEAITDRYTLAEAAVMAIQAGVDMILMPENLQEAAQGVIEAVESGQITRERIEESVLRILETKIRAGII